MTLPPEDLPPVAAAAYQQLNDQQKLAFNAYYNSRKRSMALMEALSILLPIQLFLLGRVLLGILFLITGGGVGVWYIIEWFLTPGRVRDYNARVANEGLAAVGQSSVEELPGAEEE
ncbi:MAG: TM2 domain-containing protein [Actinomycetota bacterium]